jgi:acyl-CoA synthetase (AMP-forming)/AMP-acid ligase II
MWLEQLLQRGCERAAEQICLRDARRDVHWRQLDRDARALAAVIQRATDRGDRVLILSANRVEMIEAYFACALAGTLAVPINPALTNPELSYLANAVSPTLIIADCLGRERLADISPQTPTVPIESVADLDSSDSVFPPASITEPVIMLHTSATTGHPKGVIADHRYLQFQALSWIAEMLPPRETIYLNAAPLFHGSVTIALNYLAAGGVVGILEQFTPRNFFKALDKWTVNHVFLVPSMITLLLQDQRAASLAHSSLKAIIHGGAPAPDKLVNHARATFNTPLHTIFGITEGSGPALHKGPDDQPSPSSTHGGSCAGRPMPGFSVRISTEDGDPVNVGEPGLIHLACDGLMQGYWANPDATSKAIIDGWLNTGDVGYQDEKGFIWVLDRRTDLILRGAQNVYPAEIEQILRTSTQVSEVAVVAAPSELWGQTPVAFIEPTKNNHLDQDELIALCVRELASYKRPSQFIAINRLPRNTLGKIIRQDLRQRAAEMAANHSNSSNTPVPKQ